MSQYHRFIQTESLCLITGQEEEEPEQGEEPEQEEEPEQGEESEEESAADSDGEDT